ncbi:MAG TPA: hypothetical protein VGI99_08230 [Gemmataceae bacterium]|jgi:hypothetical protein
MMRAAEQLYEQTLDPDERIPWMWIEKGVGGGTKPGGWRKHLILAAPGGAAASPEQLAGYVYGAFIPGYGGYLCYVGVAEWARRTGVATELYEAFYAAMHADAQAAEEPLPFVVWESHRPDDDPKLWNARVRLFERVGGLWIEGVDFLAPNFSEEASEPVPLQLFVKPMDKPAAAFHEQRLRGVIHGLHERVYRIDEGDPLYEGTMTPGCRPRLVPARLAATLLSV